MLLEYVVVVCNVIHKYQKTTNLLTYKLYFLILVRDISLQQMNVLLYFESGWICLQFLLTIQMHTKFDSFEACFTVMMTIMYL